MSDENGIDEGYRVLATLMAGLLLYGGLGWLGDRMLGTGFLLPTGIILGAALSLYLVVKRHSQPIPSTTHQERRRSDREESQ